MPNQADTAKAILDDMVSSAIRRAKPRWGRPATRTSIIAATIDAKTFYRARRTGWLSDRDFRELLEQCEDGHVKEFETRWVSLREFNANISKYGKAVDRTTIAGILSLDKDVHYWDGLASALLTRVSDVPWPPRPEDISLPLDALVERGRQVVGEEQALKSALVLVRAALSRGQVQRPNERLMFLSIVCAALKVAALLGHRPALRMLQSVLENLHLQYPGDPHIMRTLLCCRAITVSHARGSTHAAQRRALSHHAEEAMLAEHHIGDRVFASDWPVLYREVRGASYNLMKLRLDAGLGVHINGQLFRRHLEWQAITETLLPTGHRIADNAPLAVETEAYDVRLRAEVWLDRTDRLRLAKSAEPERALAELEGYLNPSAGKPLINRLTEGHLLGLRAEALLCLFADKQSSTRKEEYLLCKSAAEAAYVAAHDRANSEMWKSRLSVLEHSIGLETV